jgi:hypothetical protein
MQSPAVTSAMKHTVCRHRDRQELTFHNLTQGSLQHRLFCGTVAHCCAQLRTAVAQLRTAVAQLRTAVAQWRTAVAQLRTAMHSCELLWHNGAMLWHSCALLCTVANCCGTMAQWHNAVAQLRTAVHKVPSSAVCSTISPNSVSTQFNARFQRSAAM